MSTTIVEMSQFRNFLLVSSENDWGLKNNAK